jgi:hypothetical protein
MGIVDQGLSARRVQERVAQTDDPRQRAMLTTLLEHLRAEADVQVDRLVATLSDHPNYHLWQDGRDVGPVGMEAVEFDIERIVVDHDTVVTEGWIHAVNLGAVARARGWVVDDDRATYLVSQRVVIFWPFDAEGQMTGEDGYANFDPLGARKLAEDEWPEAYRQLFVGAD